MPDDRRKILKSLEITVEKGEKLFLEGDQTRDFFILIDGELDVQKNGVSIAIISTPDSYIGEMSTLLGSPRTATLVANRQSKLIRVPENKVVDFFEHSPKLGWKLAKLLALRLQQMNEKLDHIVAEIPEENEEQAEERFKELTATSYHRAFLDLYKKRVGKSLSLKDLLHELDTPAPEMNRILMVFGMAGLIDLRDRTVSFRECADRALSLKINTWNKQ